MNENSCVVVIPAYKPLTNIELRFLENALSKTSSFKHVIIAPEHLEIDHSFGKLAQLKVIRFDNGYFTNIEGYNKLMLSSAFYQKFQEGRLQLIRRRASQRSSLQ